MYIIKWYLELQCLFPIPQGFYFVVLYLFSGYFFVLWPPWTNSLWSVFFVICGHWCLCLFILLLLLLFSGPVVPDSLRPHRLQHGRPPCPSPSPGVCPSSCPVHRWYHPAISSSNAPSLSQHQRLFQWVCRSQLVTKILELQWSANEQAQWVFQTLRSGPLCVLNALAGTCQLFLTFYFPLFAELHDQSKMRDQETPRSSPSICTGKD